jgi:hypothetical protein
MPVILFIIFCRPTDPPPQGVDRGWVGGGSETLSLIRMALSSQISLMHLPFFKIVCFFPSKFPITGAESVAGDQLAGKNRGLAGRNVGAPAGGRQ